MTETEFRRQLQNQHLPKTRYDRLLFFGAVYGEFVPETNCAPLWLKFSAGRTACRFCEEPVSRDDADMVGSYWTAGGGSTYVSHPNCRDKGKKQEARGCQIIDADCNDCKFFHAVINDKESRLGYCLKFTREEKGLFARPYVSACWPDEESWREINTLYGKDPKLADEWWRDRRERILKLFDRTAHPVHPWTSAFPNFYSGLSCFVHRHSGEAH